MFPLLILAVANLLRVGLAPPGPVVIDQAAAFPVTIGMQRFIAPGFAQAIESTQQIIS